jgi:hypothetical protein
MLWRAFQLWSHFSSVGQHQLKIKKKDGLYTHTHTHTFIVMIWNFIRHRSWCEYPVWCASRVDCPFVRGGYDHRPHQLYHLLVYCTRQLFLNPPCRSLFLSFFFFHLSDVIRMTLTLALLVFLMGAFNLFPCDFCGPLVVAGRPSVYGLASCNSVWTKNRRVSCRPYPSRKSTTMDGKRKNSFFACEKEKMSSRRFLVPSKYIKINNNQT